MSARERERREDYYLFAVLEEVSSSHRRGSRGECLGIGIDVLGGWDKKSLARTLPSFSRPFLSPPVENVSVAFQPSTKTPPWIPSPSSSPSSWLPLSFLYMLRQSSSSSLSPSPQLTLLQCFERKGWPPQWPLGKDLGNRCRSVSRCVSPRARILSHSLPLPGLLLFSAAAIIAILTIRQRRRNHQRLEQPDYTYASHPPPSLVPSMPYGISRVRRSLNLIPPP